MDVDFTRHHRQPSRLPDREPLTMDTVAKRRQSRWKESHTLNPNFRVTTLASCDSNWSAMHPTNHLTARFEGKTTHALLCERVAYGTPPVPLHAWSSRIVCVRLRLLPPHANVSLAGAKRCDVIITQRRFRTSDDWIYVRWRLSFQMKSITNFHTSRKETTSTWKCADRN